MSEKHEIPLRKDVPAKDRWNLKALFPSEEAWESGLKEYSGLTPKIASFKGSLGKGPEAFLAALTFFSDFSLLEERLGYYADLRQTEDEGESSSQGRYARFVMAATEAQGAWAFFVPEIQALDEAYVEKCLADKRFADYAVYLKKLLRFRAHILSEKEERLLALQSEANGTPQEAFSVLTNVDLSFGSIDTPEGPRPLSQSTYSAFMYPRWYEKSI